MRRHVGWTSASVVRDPLRWAPFAKRNADGCCGASRWSGAWRAKDPSHPLYACAEDADSVSPVDRMSRRATTGSAGVSPAQVASNRFDTAIEAFSLVSTLISRPLVSNSGREQRRTRGMPIEDMGIRGATSRAGETPALPAECSDGACLAATSRAGRMPALPVAECDHHFPTQ